MIPVLQETITYAYTVSNTGTEDDSYNLEITDADWTAKISATSISINTGSSEDITVDHTIPADATDSDYDTGVLKTISETESEVSDSATFTTTVQKEEETTELWY